MLDAVMVDEAGSRIGRAKSVGAMHTSIRDNAMEDSKI